MADRAVELHPEALTEAKAAFDWYQERNPAAILASLDEPDSNINRLWASEAEDRIAAYRRGEIKAIPLEEVLAKYRTK